MESKILVGSIIFLICVLFLGSCAEDLTPEEINQSRDLAKKFKFILNDNRYKGKFQLTNKAYRELKQFANDFAEKPFCIKKDPSIEEIQVAIDVFTIFINEFTSKEPENGLFITKEDVLKHIEEHQQDPLRKLFDEFMN
ncbi:MAG: hypothetical protein AAF620_08560 [Bacteroidota bacterium]